MKFNPERDQRRSIRLKGYDYREAEDYFVTICARNRECLFGEITEGELRLNDRGKIVRKEWVRTAVLRPYVELDSFIVMPNHIHGIICILEGGRGTARRPLRPDDLVIRFPVPYRRLSEHSNPRARGGLMKWKRQRASYGSGIIRSTLFAMNRNGTGFGNTLPTIPSVGAKIFTTQITGTRNAQDENRRFVSRGQAPRH